MLITSFVFSSRFEGLAGARVGAAIADHFVISEYRYCDCRVEHLESPGREARRSIAWVKAECDGEELVGLLEVEVGESRSAKSG